MAASSPEDSPASRRILLALGLSLLLHGLLLSRPLAFRPFRQAPPRFAVWLKPAPAPEPRPASPLPRTSESALARQAAQRPDTVPIPRPPAAPAKGAVGAAPAPEVELPPGRELADRARASIGAIQREMTRQEARIDPQRGFWRKDAARAATHDAIALALEKHLGIRQDFVEESVEPQTDGSTLYRLRTADGAVCFKGLAPNVLLTVPGQGTAAGQFLVPMKC